MPKLLFVHGTGVRSKSYEETLGLIKSKLRDHAEVLPCYWGDLGSSLRAEGRSIPTYDSARGVDELDAGTVDQASFQENLWAVLLQDPLYELRALTLKPHGSMPPWQETEGSKLIQVARQLEISTDIERLLLQGGIHRLVVEKAMREVSSSRPFQDALIDADEDIADFRAAIARAWIADAAKLAHQASLEEAGEWAWPAITFNVELRSQLESLLIKALGGEERGVGGWVMKTMSWPLRWWLTQMGTDRRGAISDAAYPAAGDIVLYQARGEAIRGRIRERILAAGEPVHVLAHSLGGVASVDLLVMETLPVQHLITVGSQAPFLYEINALQTLPFGSPLPASLPPWLNIYDLRDFLSYVGSGVFPGRVVDLRVDNRQVFPASHSAYWWNADVWDGVISTLST